MRSSTTSGVQKSRSRWGKRIIGGPTPPAGSAVSAADYNTYLALSRFISADGRTVQLAAAPRITDTSSPAAMAMIPQLRDTVTAVAHQVGANAS